MLRSALLNVMIKAARKASRTLKRDFGEIEHLQTSLKGPANFVTAADRHAEEILREELEHARPGYGFLGEEGGATSCSPPSAARVPFSTISGCGWRHASGSATQSSPAHCRIPAAATWNSRAASIS